MVVLPRADYEALVDAAEDRDDVLAAERSLAQIAAGKVQLIPDSEMDDYLAAPTPLAFWRKKHGLTQAGLAERAGIAESELADIESGKEEGRIGVLRALAEALAVTVDELIAKSWNQAKAAD
jgi:DNA-binding XRE family transcriptional regulator